VLEVGSGAFPHSRADVLCDRYSRSDVESFSQDGNLDRPVYNQPLILYSGVETPFIDGAFDYVICSHVLEHVPAEEIFGFVAELTRIAKSGYLEFPSYALELLSNVGVHRWLINVVRDEIRLLEKSRVQEFVEQVAGTIGPIFEQLGAESPGYQALYQRYLPVWIIGLEWDRTINFRIVDSINELLDAAERSTLMAKLAAVERQPKNSKKRLLRAVKNRVRRIIKSRLASNREQKERAGLPSWISSLTACPACRQTKLRFGADEIQCESCGARYSASAGEYFLYSPSVDESRYKPLAAIENGR
jgi:hypothetical protein